MPWVMPTGRLAPTLVCCLVAGCVADPQPRGLADGGPVWDGGADVALPEMGGRGGADADADPGCSEDRYGPSTPELPAADLGVGVYTLTACPGAADHFRVVGQPGAVLHVSIDADAKVAVQVGAASWSGRSGAGRVPLGNGGALLRVEALAGATGYRLEVRRDLAAADCDDPAEPEGGAEDLVVLGEAGRVDRALCTAQDVDWMAAPTAGRWRVAVREGAGVWFDLIEGPADGPWRADARYLVAETSAELLATGAARLRIAGAGRARYSVELLPAPGSTPRGVAAVVEVPWRPWPDAPVSWLRAGQMRVDQAQPGGARVSQRLDGAGQGVLDPEGSPELVAEAWAGGYRVTVGPGAEDDRPWRSPVQAGPDGVFRPDPSDPSVAALGVALTAAEALALGLGWVPDLAQDPPPLHITWRPNAAAACGSCFHPSAHGRPRIDLSGRPSDPDEGDLAVIRHEVGHYLAAVHSRDTSPGGRHDGSAVDPELAWSEGFAHFFAAWVADDPVLVDWRLTGQRIIDLEAPIHPDAQTPWSAPFGPVSDHLVAALLWDLYDETPDEDGLALGAAAVFGVVFGQMASGVDGGAASGAELLDFLAGLACTADAPTPEAVSGYVRLDGPLECGP